MLNGESESFSATLWGPVATVMVAFASQELSFELEKKARRPEIAKALLNQRETGMGGKARQERNRANRAVTGITLK